MLRDPRTRLLRGAGLLALLAALAGLVLFVGCARNDPTKPIVDAPGGDGAPGAVVAGTVVADGRGLGDAVVTLEAMTDGKTATVARLIRESATVPTTGASSAARGPNAAAAEIRAVTTDAQGRYAFSGVAAGEYLLTARSANHLGGSRAATVSAAAAVETTFVDIALTPTGTFSGWFTLENMTAHFGTIVYIPGTSNAAVTDGVGDFVMRDVPIGTHTIRASHTGFLDREITQWLTAAGDSTWIGGAMLYRDRNIVPSAWAWYGGVCYTDNFNLNGSGYDSDGSIVLYEWDFDDDGEVDWTSAVHGNAVTTYPAGTHRARFTVTDDKGAIASSVVDIYVSPPDTVFVSAPTGAPGNPGTRAQPVNTIAEGITLAQGADCDRIILVAAGTYNESPQLVSGIRYRGGFDPTTWTRIPGTYSIVHVGAAPLTVESFAYSVSVQGFDFQADMASTPGASSIAFRGVQIGSAVQFQDCVFTAGRGATGADGAYGANGGTGGTGENGSGGSFICGFYGCSVYGGYGGAGGTGGASGGSPAPVGAMGGAGSDNDGPGFPGTTAGCGTGGAGGASSAPCPTTGLNGASGSASSGTGCAGSNGINATATSPGGLVIGTDWTPYEGHTGTPGQPGGGGPSGGGGGAGTVYFAGYNGCLRTGGGAGGGGGGGGGGAWPGQGGGGGGASFAVLLVDASPGFTDCRFIAAIAGSGGRGGNGGSGGAGGLGGAGGTGSGDSYPGDGGTGGAGGPGGPGGHGGGGSGGPGGLSYCIYKSGSSAPTITNPEYSTGSGSPGGPGGRRGGLAGLSAPDGPAGGAGTVGP